MSHIQKVRRAQGLCAYCGEPPAAGYTLCAKHLEDVRVRSRRSYQNGGAARQRARYEERRALLRTLKEGRVCARCGESHPACLDFHHRNPEAKEFQVSTFAATSRPLRVILDEVAKCDVLCANCHRKEHWNE